MVASLPDPDLPCGYCVGMDAFDQNGEVIDPNFKFSPAPHRECLEMVQQYMEDNDGY